MTMSSDDPIYAMGHSEGERHPPVGADRHLRCLGAPPVGRGRHRLRTASFDAGWGVGDVTLVWLRSSAPVERHAG